MDGVGSDKVGFSAGGQTWRFAPQRLTIQQLYPLTGGIFKVL